jgi:hypothetical protein
MNSHGRASSLRRTGRLLVFEPLCCRPAAAQAKRKQQDFGESPLARARKGRQSRLVPTDIPNPIEHDRRDIQQRLRRCCGSGSGDNGRIQSGIRSYFRPRLKMEKSCIAGQAAARYSLSGDQICKISFAGRYKKSETHDNAELKTCPIGIQKTIVKFSNETGRCSAQVVNKSETRPRLNPQGRQ